MITQATVSQEATTAMHNYLAMLTRNNPGTYGVYRLQKQVVEMIFHKDVGFVATLDRACGHFVNRNGVTATTIGPQNCWLDMWILC